MADLVVTAANVAAGSGAIINRNHNAGAAITAGQTVYLDQTAQTWKLADCDAGAITSVVGGIALHAASSGQPLAVQTGGRINPGATVAVGEIYVASGTAGGIAPKADLATGDYVTVLGIGVAANAIALAIHNGGVQVP